MTGLQVVSDTPPNFVQALHDTLDRARKGEIRGMIIITLEGDHVMTDIVKANGTSLTEILGTLPCAQDKLLGLMIP